MPKIKTKKTLIKRIKISKNGKIMRNQTSTGHLKVKWGSSRKSRKKRLLSQKNKGHIKMFRKLLGRSGRGVK